MPPHLSLTAIDGVSCSIIMKLLAQSAGLNAAQALYVDDYYEALNEAAKEGFTVMTVQELMLRQYTAEQ